MPPLLPLLMVAYVLLHNIPEIIHKIRRTKVRCAHASWPKAFYRYGLCAVTCVLLAVPVAYYGGGSHIHEAGYVSAIEANISETGL